MYVFYFRTLRCLLGFAFTGLIFAVSTDASNLSVNPIQTTFDTGFTEGDSLFAFENIIMLDSIIEYEDYNQGSFPPLWDVPVNTGYSHTYFVILSANPRVNDFSLEYGDWIGGFYLDDDGNKKCGGARMWNGDQAISVTLFGNSPYTSHKDGFSNGELIEFRVFLWSTQKQYTITDIEFLVAPYFVYNGRWYNMSISRILDMQSQVNLDFFINPSANPICINNQISLSAEEFVGSGGSYSFEWTSDLLGFFSNLQNPPPLTLDQTTLFSLQVTDGIDTSNHSLTVVVHDHPSVIAGENIVKCVNATIQLSGQAQNALNTEWVTSGDGTFCDPMNINAVYTPGDQDKVNGSVILTLLAEPLSPCTFIDSDALTVTLAPLPTVFAGNDMSACGNDIVMLQAIVSDFSAVEWFSSGDGTFTEKYELETQYLPAGNDITNGVTLTICAEPISPCVLSICDEVSISYLPGPTANAPDILRLCENQNINVSANVTNNSGVLWTTQGDGSFGDPNQLNTYYTPGLQDIENDGTVITIEALPIAPCEISAFKNINLEIQKLPRVIDFGPNTNYMCKNNLFVQLNAVVQEYTTLSWSTSGDGFFTSLTNPVTRYYPGSNDKATGQFTLTITANPKQFCQVQTIESKTINIVDNPTIEIVSPVVNILCETDAVELEVAGQHFNEVQWTTSGDGYFDNSTSPNPIYYPGAGDLTGNVVITVTAPPISPCTATAVSDIDISFIKQPQAFAGEDATIFYFETFITSDAQAFNYSQVLWSSGGDGIFSDEESLITGYIPGPGDITNNFATLTLTAFPESPCEVAATDTLTLIILVDGCLDATAYAGGNKTICSNENLFISNATAGFYSSLLWTTTGDGYFDNPAKLRPVYFPGNGDVLSGSVELCLKATAYEDCDDFTDCMILTIVQPPFAFAGDDTTICEGSALQLAGIAENHAGIQWQTSGDGYFSHPNGLVSNYIHGPNDLLSGSVQICLTAESNPGCADVTSCFTLFIQASPAVNAGTDITICADQPLQLNATASHYGGLNWQTDGDGTFSNNGVLNPLYYPGTADIANGTVNLCLTAQGKNGCDDVTGCFSVSLQAAPSANAGSNFTVCENEDINLYGIAGNYQAISWSTTGDGYFSSSGNLQTNYTPGTQDIAAGEVTLCLKATGISTCDDAEDCIVVTIVKAPSVNAGNNIHTCETSTIILNATGNNYGQLIWTTSGDGSFSNPGGLSTQYIPGISDYISGQVQLCLTATGNTPCADVSDCLTLFIYQLPIVYSGDDATICAGNTYQLDGFAQHFSSLLWETSGDGQFSCTETLNAIYTPGPNDISQTSVQICLTASGRVDCADETHCFTLSIQPQPIVNAGTDATIEIGETYHLQSAFVQHAQSAIWMTSGTGFFNNFTSTNPVYNPSQSDYDVGSVVLTLEAYPLNPCTISKVDNMTLTFVLGCENAIADAGDDFTACGDGSSFELQGFAQNHVEVLWSSTGDGYFVNEVELNTVYHPGPNDILAGSVNVCLTAKALGDCENDTDCITITLTSPPLPDAGNDATICETDLYVELAGSCQHCDEVQWTTSGDGFFILPNVAIANYYPGNQDRINGQVVLTFSGVNQYCEPVSDQLTLFITPAPVIFAGPDDEVCEGDKFFTGEAFGFNFESVSWTTSGDGAFNNGSALNTFYTPGPGDISAGSAQLTITAFASSPCQNEQDSFVLTILPNAQVDAGADIYICQNETAALNATAQNYTSVLWETAGDGSFDNSGNLSTYYTPGENDINQGVVMIQITAFTDNGCNHDNDHLTIFIEKAPVVDAGNDQTICETGNAALNASVQNHSQINWSTSGDGTFSNNQIADPVYYPGSSDIANGSVDVTLTAYGLQYCESVSDELTISLQPVPTVSAGADLTVCENTSQIQLNGEANHHTSLMWHSFGDGYFDDASKPDANYFPGTNDLTGGMVQLCLSAEGLFGCETAEDCIEISFQTMPDVFAGNDLTICEGNAASLIATAQNWASVFWSTTGNGYFDNPNNPEAIYYPGSDDIAQGFVSLCVTAEGLNGCPEISDCVEITILKKPVILIEESMAVCENEMVPVSASAQNYSAISWTTSGNGVFNDPNALETIYEPGPQDLVNGFVELCFTASGNSPCQDVTECMVVTFTPLPSVYAGEDATIGNDNAFYFNDAFASQYDYLEWTSSGTGYFNDNSLMNPVYTPSYDDIIAQQVVLTLTAYPLDPCQESASDHITLTIWYDCLDAQADAGGDIAFCVDQDVALDNASAAHYVSLLWTTNGDGSFSDPTALNPQYLPGTTDLASGSVVVCLTAFADEDCNDHQDCITISFIELPEVFAGSDKVWPVEEPLWLDEAWAENYSSVQWITTNGMGVFSSESIVNPVYTASQYDAMYPYIELVIIASPINPCTVFSDDADLCNFLRWLPRCHC
jgi:hypothetical protein